MALAEGCKLVIIKTPKPIGFIAKAPAGQGVIYCHCHVIPTRCRFGRRGRGAHFWRGDRPAYEEPLIQKEVQEALCPLVPEVKEVVASRPPDGYCIWK